MQRAPDQLDNDLNFVSSFIKKQCIPTVCQRLAKHLMEFIVGELAIGIHTGKCLIARDEGDRQDATREYSRETWRGAEVGQERTWPTVPGRGKTLCEAPRQKEVLKRFQCGWSMTRAQGNMRGRQRAGSGQAVWGMG